ncbi:NAD(P)H-hydrate epimerase, partial [Streptomyces bambusae]
MRTAYGVETVRAAERELMARLPEGALMQRAAAGLAAACAQLLRGADLASEPGSEPGSERGYGRGGSAGRGRRRGGRRGFGARQVGDAWFSAGEIGDARFGAGRVGDARSGIGRVADVGFSAGEAGDALGRAGQVGDARFGAGRVADMGFLAGEVGDVPGGGGWVPGVRRRVVGARVGVLAGVGDNGGDALYAGARLARRGARVHAVLLDPQRVHAGGLAALLAAGGRVAEALPD